MVASQRKKQLKSIAKWALYVLVMYVFLVVQQIPGFLAINTIIKPIFLISVCVAVAMVELEFKGAIFAVIGGTLLDISSGRQAGLFAILLMVCCFFVAYAVRVFFRASYFNFMVFVLLVSLLVTGLDFLFGHILFRYGGYSVEYFGKIFPICIYTAFLSFPSLFLIRKIHNIFATD